MDPVLQSYLKSPKFRLVADEQLRCLAVDTVEKLIEELKPVLVKRAQIHPIISTLQAYGIGGLVRLAEKQKDRNTKKENKKFWSLMYRYLTDETDATSLRAVTIQNLKELGVFKDVKGIQDKATANRQKSLNREAIKGLLDAFALPFFEHFTCEYYFRAKEEQGG